MDLPPGFKSGSVSFVGLGDWRDQSRLKNMSISELISELRDTFLKSDFDRVEETLVAREAKLKAEIEEKKREIGLLQENLQLEMLDKINVELDLKRVMGERREEALVKVRENGNGFGLNCKVVKSELGCEISKHEVLNDRGVAVAKVEGEKVGVFVEKKKRVCEQSNKDGLGFSGEKVGILAEKKRCIGEPRRKDGLGSSGRRLGIGTVINIGDSGEDERNLQAALSKRETNSRVIADTERQSKSEAVQKNLATRLAKPVGITAGNDVYRVAREAILKAGIVDKMRKIESLQGKNRFNSFERLNFETELKTVRGERRGEELVNAGANGNGFDLDDGKVVKAESGHERCKLEALKNRGVGDGVASAVVKLEGEKVEVLAEKKRLVGEPSKKDGLGALGERLGIETVIILDDSDEDERLNSKETTSNDIADKARQSSSGEVQRNPWMASNVIASSREFGTNINIREFGTNINNILDGLENDVSSSSSSFSSSSGELDVDSFPLGSLSSNKKMRTNAGNLGLNSLNKGEPR